MAEADEVMDVQAAAAYLKLNDQTLRRFARNGLVPAFRLGGRWRFRRTALDAWAESQDRTDSTTGAEPVVLVVDDEQTVLDVVGRQLASEGFRVETALGGIEALRLIQARVPDLVVLDLVMDGMDGPEILREIRARCGDLPVIILTGYPDSDLMHEALQYSPLTLLAKPADPEKLISAARRALPARGTAV